jgi:fructokinase
MQQSHLFPMIRKEFAQLLNGYVRHRDILDHLDEYIQPPRLGGEAGILGALVLAESEAAGEVLNHIVRSREKAQGSHA